MTTSGGADIEETAGLDPDPGRTGRSPTGAVDGSLTVPVRDLDVVAVISGDAGPALLLEAGRAAFGTVLVVGERAPRECHRVRAGDQRARGGGPDRLVERGGGSMRYGWVAAVLLVASVQLAQAWDGATVLFGLAALLGFLALPLKKLVPAGLAGLGLMTVAMAGGYLAARGAVPDRDPTQRAARHRAAPAHRRAPRSRHPRIARPRAAAGLRRLRGDGAVDHQATHGVVRARSRRRDALRVRRAAHRGQSRPLRHHRTGSGRAAGVRLADHRPARPRRAARRARRDARRADVADDRVAHQRLRAAQTRRATDHGRARSPTRSRNSRPGPPRARPNSSGCVAPRCRCGW